MHFLFWEQVEHQSQICPILGFRDFLRIKEYWFFFDENNLWDFAGTRRTDHLAQLFFEHNKILCEQLWAFVFFFYYSGEVQVKMVCIVGGQDDFELIAMKFILKLSQADSIGSFY